MQPYLDLHNYLSYKALWILHDHSAAFPSYVPHCIWKKMHFSGMPQNYKPYSPESVHSDSADAKNP